MNIATAMVSEVPGDLVGSYERCLLSGVLGEPHERRPLEFYVNL